MVLRKALREKAFNLARRDLAEFLTDHEEDLLAIFREEMQQLDQEIPEESMFIDIKMVPLGEAILKSALHAISRFLTEELPSSRTSAVKVDVPINDESKTSTLTLKGESS